MLLWTAIGFLAGSLPFSVWLGRLAAHADVRRYGDGNPGAANAWKAGGWQVGAAALLLDAFKGGVPVGLAHFWAGLGGWELVPVALAPVLGHAFSPFLGFRGGKALAVTFGVWAGLTLGEVPIVLGLLFALFLWVFDNNAWAVMAGLVGLLAYLLYRQAGSPLLAVWAGNALILAWKHRHDLRRRVHLKARLGRLPRRRRAR